MIISLEERAYEHIRSLLQRGTLAPGSPVRESALGKTIGVSRTPVRHAIRQLEREGLLVQVRGFGSYVREPDPREIQEIAELRVTIERGAAGLAAERITPAGVAGLRDVCQEMRVIAAEARAMSTPTLPPALAERDERADETFHEMIVRASGNDRMVKLVTDMNLIARIASYPRHQALQKPQLLLFLARCYREHYRIFQAIRARDARLASNRMESHLSYAAKTVVEWATWSSNQSPLQVAPGA